MSENSIPNISDEHRIPSASSSTPHSHSVNNVTLDSFSTSSPQSRYRTRDDLRFGVSPPSGRRRQMDDELRLGISHATPPSIGRGRPSDSGYGTDSPASINTSAILFRYEDDMEVAEEGAVGYTGRLLHRGEGHHDGDEDFDEYTLGVPEMEEGEEDDEVFLECPVIDFQLSFDEVDGRSDLPEERSSENDSQTINSSQPIDIPRPLIVPNEPRNFTFTPARYHNRHTMAFWPGGLYWIGSPQRGNEGHIGTVGMVALASRFHSPNNLHHSVMPSAVPSQPVEPRSRFFSEGDVLRVVASRSHPGGTGMGQAVLDHTARVAARRQVPRRDRALSEPSLQIRLQRQFGRELRRISDEFHLSYQIVQSVEHGVHSASLSGSSSFPGGRRHRGSWWDHIVHLISPPRLETVESPDIQDDNDHPLSFQNSAVRNNDQFNDERQFMDSGEGVDASLVLHHESQADDDSLLDDVDGVFMSYEMGPKSQSDQH